MAHGRNRCNIRDIHAHTDRNLWNAIAIKPMVNNAKQHIFITISNTKDTWNEQYKRLWRLLLVIRFIYLFLVGTFFICFSLHFRCLHMTCHIEYSVLCNKIILTSCGDTCGGWYRLLLWFKPIKASTGWYFHFVKRMTQSVCKTIQMNPKHNTKFNFCNCCVHQNH